MIRSRTNFSGLALIGIDVRGHVLAGHQACGGKPREGDAPVLETWVRKSESGEGWAGGLRSNSSQPPS